MRIVEYRFALEDDANPVTVLNEITMGMETTILGGVLLKNTGFGSLIASSHVDDMVHNLTDEHQREVAASLLRGE